MAFSGKVNDIVGIEFAQDGIDKRAVADITFDEAHVGQLDFIFDCHQIAGICKGIQDYDFYVRTILAEKIFHKVGADKAGCTV